MTQKFFSPMKTYATRDVHLLDDLQEICGELDCYLWTPRFFGDDDEGPDLCIHAYEAMRSLLNSMQEVPACKG